MSPRCCWDGSGVLPLPSEAVKSLYVWNRQRNGWPRRWYVVYPRRTAWISTRACTHRRPIVAERTTLCVAGTELVLHEVSLCCGCLCVNVHARLCESAVRRSLPPMEMLLPCYGTGRNPTCRVKSVLCSSTMTEAVVVSCRVRPR